MADKIRVLVTEDSIFVQKLLIKILESDPAIEVVGVARNGRESVELVQKLNPDLVTMDIRMPVMDGFQATQTIMNVKPTPILVISSSVSSEDLRISFNAIQAGALDIIEKPHGSLTSDYRVVGAEIIRRVKIFSGVKVFRHLSPALRRDVAWAPGKKAKEREVAITIGASTGGPSALHHFLQAVPEDLPATVFVTQHISEGFGAGCVEWLGRSAKVRVKMGEDGESIIPGTVYFAPDRGLLELYGKSRVRVRKPLPGEERSNIDAMMLSVAAAYRDKTVGILLTGMGSDGVRGLESIKNKGGRTIVQDEKTSIVFGMPKAAIQKGVADEILPLEEILPALLKMLDGPGGSR